MSDAATDRADALPEEVWAVIPGHWNYEASTHGRVRNARTLHVLRPQGHTRGYLKVDLGKRKGVNCQMLVHRAVALAHIPLPDDGDLFTVWDVDHLDFDRQNNRRGNLRWLRAEHNRARWLRHNLDREAEEAAEHVPLTPDEQAAFEHALAGGGW